MNKTFRILLPTASVLIIGLLAVIFSLYYTERVSAYIDPWDAPKHTDDQLTEALIAFGRS